MLKVTRKEYEIEELVQGFDKNDELAYEFKMQITSDELTKINEIIINKESVELATQSAKLEGKELEDIEKKMIELALVNQETFENICFKEHKQPFKEAMGDFKYLEMVELLFDLFWNDFVGKKAQRINTMSSDLRKITGK